MKNYLFSTPMAKYLNEENAVMNGARFCHVVFLACGAPDKARKHNNTFHASCFRFVFVLSLHFRLAGRMVKNVKHDKSRIWNIFVFSPFVPPYEDTIVTGRKWENTMKVRLK